MLIFPRPDSRRRMGNIGTDGTTHETCRGRDGWRSRRRRKVLPSLRAWRDEWGPRIRRGAACEQDAKKKGSADCLMRYGHQCRAGAAESKAQPTHMRSVVRKSDSNGARIWSLR